MRYLRPSYKPSCVFIDTVNPAPRNGASVDPDGDWEEAGVQRPLL